LARARSWISRSTGWTIQHPHVTESRGGNGRSIGRRKADTLECRERVVAGSSTGGQKRRRDAVRAIGRWTPEIGWHARQLVGSLRDRSYAVLDRLQRPRCRRAHFDPRSALRAPPRGSLLTWLIGDSSSALSRSLGAGSTRESQRARWG
jgi:hypothetical protein